MPSHRTPRPSRETRCNGRCHEAGTQGVYFDLDCPKHITGPIRAWLLADDDEDGE